jgi:hypothetical protein
MPLFNQSGYGSGKYGIADGGPIYSLPLNYYLNLFTSEYKLAPNLNAWARALLTPLDDITTCIGGMTEAFDLDNAVGVQLDTLGVIIGQSRTVGFQPSGGVSPVLDDDTYRLLLKAKIAFNQWDGLQTSLQAIWQSLFSGGTIVVHDNQNMSAIIVLTGSFSSIIQDLIVNGLIVPRPETVQFTVTFGLLPILGFDSNNAFIAGFDSGHFL